ncbi:hypothetical protein ACIRYZ_18080 [Kitasatospora sp. NPDC101155]|uniref:hypothetical protein n=1 Tax=Kitasatospora sp. NPDC101155 TaxID=3364097 RepID=UPI0037F5A84D
MPDQDQPQDGDVLVDMTPVAPIPTLPPPPGSRRRLWLTLAAFGFAAVIALALAFAHDTANLGTYRYSPPEDFLGLPRVPAGQLPKASPLPSGTKVGGYQTEDGSRSVALTVRELPIVSPSAVIDTVITEAATGRHVEGLRTVDPGERGGVMKCGHITDMMKKAGKPQDIAFCVWVDGSMWAVYMEHGDDITLDTDDLANDARKFRHLAEVPS